MERLDVAIVGAGPFGLSIGAHLAMRRRVRVFGEPMRTWRRLMPPDMLLRSDWEHTNLAAPGGAGTLERWVADSGEERTEPIPLTAFLRYGDWFRSRFVDDHVDDDVARLEAADGGLRLTTARGDVVQAESAVLAVGVTPFPNSPRALRGVEDERIVHAIQHGGFAGFAGLRVVVIGAGQNGLESALLASEAGADVEILVRSEVRWYTPREPYTPRSPLRRRIYRLAYPVVGFGPPGLNRIVLHPDLFARLPSEWRNRLDAFLLRAGGSPWIRSRIDGRIPISEGVEVERVEARPDALVLHLSDGGTREVDRVIVAVGYRFDRDRLTFVDEGLRARIEQRDGWPVIDADLRSTEPRLLFAGYPAEGRFGPLTRFVEGTRFAAERCLRALS
jgi:cation diffusion facilitator CzcD-associated flavoprotein CzcO